MATEGQPLNSRRHKKVKRKCKILDISQILKKFFPTTLFTLFTVLIKDETFEEVC